jgi:hypothetical protein
MRWNRYRRQFLVSSQTPWTRKPNRRRALLQSLVAAGVLAWIGWYVTIGRDNVTRVPYEENYFGASQTRTQDGRFIPATELGNSDYCGHCHTDIFHQWDASTHHFSSFNDPYYRRVAQDVAGNRGNDAVKFCAGCHDPLPLVSGNMPPRNSESWAANAGITCLSCHRIVELRGHENGSYVLSPPVLHPFALTDRPVMQELHGWLVKLTPSLHRAMLMKPVYRSSEFCVTCHTVRLPKAINGASDLVIQEETRPMTAGSPHANVSHAQPAQNCQDCHMPLVRSSDPAARDGFIHSHRFLGGNTGITTFNRDSDQLQDAQAFLSHAQLSLAIVPSLRVASVKGQNPSQRSRPMIDLSVSVTNQRVGHSFPAGTADSNEAWLEIDVRDARDISVFSRGKTDISQPLPPGTYQFGVEFVDRLGMSTDRRSTATQAVAVRTSTVLGPHESRKLDYTFRLPAYARLPLTVTARVNWRKFSPDFTNWTFGGRKVEPLPITVLATSVATLADGTTSYNQE